MSLIFISKCLLCTGGFVLCIMLYKVNSCFLGTHEKKYKQKKTHLFITHLKLKDPGSNPFFTQLSLPSAHPKAILPGDGCYSLASYDVKQCGWCNTFCIHRCLASSIGSLCAFFGGLEIQKMAGQMAGRSPSGASWG